MEVASPSTAARQTSYTRANDADEGETNIMSVEEAFCDLPTTGHAACEAVKSLLYSVRIKQLEEMLSREQRPQLISAVASQCGEKWTRILVKLHPRAIESKRQRETLRLLAMYVGILAIEVFMKVPRLLKAMREGGVFTNHANFVRICAEAGVMMSQKVDSINVTCWMKSPTFTSKDFFNWQQRQQQKILGKKIRTSAASDPVARMSDFQEELSSAVDHVKSYYHTLPWDSIQNFRPKVKTAQTSAKDSSSALSHDSDMPSCPQLMRGPLDRCPSLPELNTSKTLGGLDIDDTLLHNQMDWRHDNGLTERQRAQSCRSRPSSSGVLLGSAQASSDYKTMTTSVQRPIARPLSPSTHPLIHAVVRERARLPPLPTDVKSIASVKVREATPKVGELNQEQPPTSDGELRPLTARSMARHAARLSISKSSFDSSVHGTGSEAMVHQVDWNMLGLSQMQHLDRSLLDVGRGGSITSLPPQHQQQEPWESDLASDLTTPRLAPAESVTASLLSLPLHSPRVSNLRAGREASYGSSGVLGSSDSMIAMSGQMPSRQNTLQVGVALSHTKAAAVESASQDFLTDSQTPLAEEAGGEESGRSSLSTDGSGSCVASIPESSAVSFLSDGAFDGDDEDEDASDSDTEGEDLLEQYDMSTLQSLRSAAQLDQVSHLMDMMVVYFNKYVRQPSSMAPEKHDLETEQANKVHTTPQATRTFIASSSQPKSIIEPSIQIVEDRNLDFDLENSSTLIADSSVTVLTDTGPYPYTSAKQAQETQAHISEVSLEEVPSPPDDHAHLNNEPRELEVEGNSVCDISPAHSASSKIPCAAEEAGTTSTSSTLPAMDNKLAHELAVFRKERAEDVPMHAIDVVELKVADYHDLRPMHIAWARVPDRELYIDLVVSEQDWIYNPLIHKISRQIEVDLDRNMEEERSLKDACDQLEKIIPALHTQYDQDTNIYQAPQSMGMPSTSLFGSSYICQGDGFDVDEKLQVAAEPPWQRHEYGEWLKNFGKHGGFHIGMEKAAEGSSATEPTMTTQEKRRFHSWKELWKETISSEDYFRYLTQRETDFLHSTFHLYDSEEEEVEETIEPSDHMRGKSWLPEAGKTKQGLWSVPDVLADLLEDDVEDDDTDRVSFNDRLLEDKKALRREREEDSWLVIKEKKEMEQRQQVQTELQQTWQQYEMSEHVLLDLSIKYCGQHLSMEVLRKARDLWSRILSLVLRREEQIATWDVHPSFLPEGVAGAEDGGATASTSSLQTPLWKKQSHRFDKALSRQQARLTRLESEINTAIAELKRDFGDDVNYRGVDYRERMRRDKTERLYWLHHQRRKDAIDDAGHRQAVAVSTVNL